MDEKELFLESARDDLVSYITMCDELYQFEDIHRTIAKELESLEKGEINDLMLMLPPRAGKSRLVTEFVSWYLGRHPRNEVIYSGHSLSLLKGFNSDIIDRMKSKDYKEIFKTRLADKNVLNPTTTEGGGCAIYGVGAGVTGRGGDVIIVDDPYATRQEAESVTGRKTVLDWYQSTMKSRKKDANTKTIIIMQRWNPEDLIGEILKKEEETGKHKFKQVVIPAIQIDSEGNEKSFWEKKKDGSEKFPLDYLYETRDDIGEYFFNSQYQQDPTILVDGDFNQGQIQYYSFLELQSIYKHLDIISILDPAFSEKEGADSSGLVTIGYNKMTNKTYLLEVKKMTNNPDYVSTNVIDTVSTFAPLKETSNGYQNVSIGKSYLFCFEKIQGFTLLKMIRDRKIEENMTFRIEEIGRTGDKVARIRTTLLPLYSSGGIYHPDWDIGTKSAIVGGKRTVVDKGTTALEKELLAFPFGKHDDLIDPLSLGVSKIKVVKKDKRDRIKNGVIPKIVGININEL